LSAPPYPFTAVVGLDDLRLALVVNAVSPAVGGVLVRGEKGTAKSTVVRALAALLPPVVVAAGCRFSCDPALPDPGCPDRALHGDATVRPARLVELPVGASEDRLVGSLDLEQALTTGVSAYEPGLLAQAHRGVLYVDEVNLLHDHLVDLLLDAAALGTVLRRARGRLRPARRPLPAGRDDEPRGGRAAAAAARPVRPDRRGGRHPRPGRAGRRGAPPDGVRGGPGRFAADYAASDAELAARIAAARERLPRVVLGDRALREVTTVCAAFDVDGLRADLVTAKAAVALAAWAGRTRSPPRTSAPPPGLALPHRRRRTPFEAPGLDEQQLDDALDSVPPGRPGPRRRPEGSGRGARPRTRS
jgi:magnesium chelatase subunit D